MSEMSLYQQVHQIENMMQYIDLVSEEAIRMCESVVGQVVYLRQNGLRTETADMIERTHLANINDILEPMLHRMNVRDKSFLDEVREDLIRAANR